MGKLIMATMEMDGIEITVTDIQNISKVPESVRNVIKENVTGRRLNKNGLPSVLYLGENGVRVIGAFKYGDIAFLDVEGRINDLVKSNGLVCIAAYRPEYNYEQLKDNKESYLKGLEEKYPNGLNITEDGYTES